MPRYYCDYCDAYLTHDSASVRKQHVTGFKHKANVRAYYALFEQQLCIHEEQIRAREFQQSRRQAIQPRCTTSFSSSSTRRRCASLTCTHNNNSKHLSSSSSNNNHNNNNSLLRRRVRSGALASRPEGK